jgi:hypothetical protein
MRSIRSVRRPFAVTWDTTADDCTVLSSASGPIPEGTVAMFRGLAATRSPADEVVLVTPDGATATGHCIRHRNGPGSCIFVLGTGWLAGFHASLNVTSSPESVVRWEGTFYFRPTA